MLTAIEHGSVGPKRMAKAISESKAMSVSQQYHRMTRKGIRLIFLNQDGEIIAGWCMFNDVYCPVDIGGNANKRVDAVGRMGKSCLFFLSLLSF